LALAALAASAQSPRPQAEAGSLEALGREFRAQPTPARRAALESFLLRHPRDVDGALARLVLFQGDSSAAGRKALEAARGLLPQITDYADWMIAASAGLAEDYGASYEAAQRALAVGGTPMESRAALLGLKAAYQMLDGAKMRDLLARHAKALTPAQAEFFAGQAAEAEGNSAALEQRCRKVYLEFPRAPEAAECAARLQTAAIAPAQLAERAFRLLEAGDAGGAKAALTGLVARLEGGARDYAVVRIGVAEYRLRSPLAMATLERARVGTPEADAERLFYLLLAARRAKAYDAMARAMEELNQRHAQSPWRLEGLANAAGQYWVMGDNERSLPLYQSCATEFRQQAMARACEWKVALASHILRRPEAEPKLLEYLERDPMGEHASAALYFLGRAAEDRRDRAAAKAYYAQAIEVFPNQFYAELCRERVEQQKLGPVAASATAVAKLREIRFAGGAAALNFEPTPETRRRIERSHLLARAGLYDLAELELRHEGRTNAQSHVLALEAARLAVRRGAPEQGIRYIKSLYPGYVNLPLSTVTLPLLKLAYPLPYKDELLTHAFKNEVDPYLVAGLIRQESEFAATAVSRSNAHGLMQIMPATGKELARRLSLPGFSRQKLFEPQTNVQMGTYYFKRLLDSLGGSMAQALASYNAGKGRVTEWLGRREGLAEGDPAEFIETIPFDETRNYVQAVIRNAGMYRRIYGAAPGPVALQAEAAAPELKQPELKTPAVKKPAPTASPKKSAANAASSKAAPPKKAAARRKG
jgi:soluble lytic murein transglycosylase